MPTKTSEPAATAGAAARWRNLLITALQGTQASPLHFGVHVVAVAASVCFVMAGLALSEGLRQEAQAALQDGADLFVAGEEFGDDASLDPARGAPLATLPGVLAVVPRIIGRLRLGPEWATVIGLDREAWQQVPAERRIALPAPGALLLGEALAQRTGFRAGKQVLLEGRTNLVSQVEATLPAGAGVGSAAAVVMDRADAAALFGQPERVSDLLVYCRPGYAERLAAQIARDPTLRVQSRALVSRYLDRAYTLRAGALGVVFAFAIAVTVPVFLLLLQLGASPRRREIAILKTCGFRTTDVLVLNLIENLLVAVTGWALGFVAALAWVRGLGAPLLRAYFVPGSFATTGSLELPAVFGSLPLATGLVLAVALTSTAGILTVWRSTTVPASTAVRT